MSYETADFDITQVFGPDAPLSRLTQHVEIQCLLAKLRYGLSQAGYHSKYHWFQLESGCDGVLLCGEGQFWAVNLVYEGAPQPSALFIDIKDAAHFFLHKLTHGELSMATVEGAPGSAWNFPCDANDQPGLYCAFRAKQE